MNNPIVIQDMLTAMTECDIKKKMNNDLSSGSNHELQYSSWLYNKNER